MKIKDLLEQGKFKEIFTSSWGVNTYPLLHVQYNNIMLKYSRSIISREQFSLAIQGFADFLIEHGEVNIPLFQVGDKVKPSKSCRKLYGDPDVLTITQIKEGKYLTNIYSIWFEEHELLPLC